MHICFPINHFNFQFPFPDPRSSLLTIGRVPMMNALQDYSRHIASQQPPIVHAQRDYQLACRNTCAFPVSPCVCVERSLFILIWFEFWALFDFCWFFCYPKMMSKACDTCTYSVLPHVVCSVLDSVCIGVAGSPAGPALAGPIF